jgi:glycosyltransferase involved in cell wall biosynthesis
MTAIRAFAIVKREHPEATLRMVGPDEDGTLATCHDLVSELKLEGSVEFSGRISKAEIPRLANLFDIFLNATHYESFGVAVMEAAASGLCIVTTNVGELPLLWRHGEDALLVPPGDVSRMAEEIQRILTEPGLAKRLSCNARTKAEKYDWPFILPLWENAISRVCAQPGD